MKKYLFLLPLLFLLLCPLTALAADSSSVAVYLDDELQGYTALSRGGETLLPLRSICQATGKSIDYIHETTEIKFAAKHALFTLKLGDTQVLCDGEAIEPLPAAPYAYEGHVYLPAATAAELLGLDIVEEQGQVRIYTYFLYERARTGEPTMGYDTLYRVSRNGDKVEIFQNWKICGYVANADIYKEMTVYDGYCYVRCATMLGKYEIFKVSVYGDREKGTDEALLLGDDLYNYLLPPEGITVSEEGVKVIGYTNGYETYMGVDYPEETKQLMRDSYGYYLLDLEGNGQQFIEQLEWPYNN